MKRGTFDVLMKIAEGLVGLAILAGYVWATYEVFTRLGPPR